MLSSMIVSVFFFDVINTYTITYDITTKKVHVNGR